MLATAASRRARVLRPFSRAVSYVQGQSPSPKTREYFYYVDHQGQLFLDDTKVKNFITCFKDKKFLAFFFKRLRLNTSDCYSTEFPYMSPCGREMNYIRCEDLPLVFTHLLDSNGEIIQDISTYATKDAENLHPDLLSYGGTGDLLTVHFQPEKLCMLPGSGRIYHTGPTQGGGVGLVKSSLALELSGFFRYEEGADREADSPVAFQWRGETYQLDNSVISDLHRLQTMQFTES